MTRTHTVYLASRPSCCNGLGYVVVVDGLDDQPCALEACRCPAGKEWAARQGGSVNDLTDEITRYLKVVPGGLNGRFRALWRLGGCAEPVRVRGELKYIDSDGVARTVYTTRRELGGVLLVPCGNRRASRCPACSQVYRADTFHLIRAGLVGGKGVPGSVRAHPRVLATFTAPGFGPVHTHRERGGRMLPCRPRRSKPVCPHGRPAYCTQTHTADDPQVGQPLCGDCYDYAGHVLWNAHAPDLWRRLTIYLRRELAHRAGMSASVFDRQVRVSFAKVAEYQARGIVHFHAIIRLDGRTDTDEVIPPPDWATIELLEAAIRAAAATVCLTVSAGPDIGVRRMRFGTQLDVHPIVPHELAEGELTEEKVAGYIAKYATKGATTEGTVDRRIKSLDQVAKLALTDHQRRLIQTCWELGARGELEHLRLRQWAHMLGFRGHFSTKSRAYSTTLGALRQVRRSFRAHQARTTRLDPLTGQAPGEDTTLVIGSWTFAGKGYLNPLDDWVAQLIRAERDHQRRSRHPTTLIEPATAAGVRS